RRGGSARAALAAAPAWRMDLPARRRAQAPVASLRRRQSALPLARAARREGAHVTGEVLSARRGRGHARHGLEELWARVQSRGWLDDAAPRVVIQVGNAGADRLLADTVHGLAAFLRSRMGVSRVDVLDLHGGDWTPLRRLGMPAADVVEIAGIAE